MLSVVRGVSASLCLTAVLSYFLPSLLDVFALVPINTIGARFYFWNLVTSGVVEGRPLALILVPAILLMAQTIEVSWERKESIVFLVSVFVFTSVCTFFTTYAFVLFLGADYMMSQWYGGGAALFAALTVALKQQLGDQEVNIGPLAVRAKYCTLLSLLIAIVADFVFRTGPAARASATTTGNAPAGSMLPFFFFGGYGGWLYLRFIKGDFSEDFGLHSFLPEPFHCLMRPVCAVSYAGARKVGLFGQWHTQWQAHVQAEAGGRALRAQTQEEEARERHRRLAIEQLSKRLADREAGVQVQTANDDDDDELV